MKEAGRFVMVLTTVGVFALGGCRDAGSAKGGSASAADAPEPTPRKISFNDHIQPILSENCYACHGPDASSRKAGLRLDRPGHAFAPHEDSGPAIIRGEPDLSPLVRRIETTDPEEIMPPPEAHKTLTPDEIALLRHWIGQGAEYEEHWAFVAPVRQAPPSVARTNPNWPHNDIDRFILARLESEGLQSSPEADRATLIRRVSYDLTGLPPEPAEVDAFIADGSADAYEKIVDRLLASPRYGEHRARYWLDVARYGDTHGLHLDNYRSIWPYRDYVIKAFNANMPFDQFVREQLAGDLLPAERVDQLVASAFIRAGISSGESGSRVEELRVTNQIERTETFGAAFLGLTTGCAACHDHKFDPLSQRDFYRLSAFFNNLTESPSNDDRDDWPPFIRLPAPENRDAYNRTLARRADVQRQIDVRRAQARALIETWLAQPELEPCAVATRGLAVRLRFDEQRGSTFTNSAPGRSPESVTATGADPAWGEDVWLWPSLRMESGTRIEMAGVGDVEADQPFSVGAWVMPRLETAAVARRLHMGSLISRIDPEPGHRGWELYYAAGKIVFNLAHKQSPIPRPRSKSEAQFNPTGDPDDPVAAAEANRLSKKAPHPEVSPDQLRSPDGDEDAIRVVTKNTRLARGRWTHVFMTYDGSGRAAGVKLYIDGEPQEVVVLTDSLSGPVRTTAPLHLGRRHPDVEPLRETRFQDFRFYTRTLSEDESTRVAMEDHVAEIAHRPMAEWSEDEFKTVADFYFVRHDTVMPGLVAEITRINIELERLSKDGLYTLVSEESPRLAYADVLDRGVFTERRERVRPGTPDFLPPLPPDAPLDRRGLAEWTVSGTNPLTARVTVNRMWQELFGTGLVESPDDFGIVGARPSHPGLLDWLAVDFRDSGWDVKRFYRQLVMSAAYRQSARVTPALLEKDPKNRLLARGPRFRMDAEMLRDTALAASGRLVERLGGPSVKPYQPPGVWESGGFPFSDTTHYRPDHGEALYRRSLYTFWKRMATMPNMDVLDAPVRDVVCTRRQRTNTPLQALVLMNDPQWLEAARSLAERAIKTEPQPEARLDFVGRVLLARPWRAAEKAILESALAQYQATYAADPVAAAKFVSIGESEPDRNIAATELAPWMLVASAAMNLDATLNK